MIGFDVEMFVVDTSGLVVPAWEIIHPHDKDNPLNEGGFALHYDNVMLEVAGPPANSSDEFAFTITQGVALAEQFVKSYNPELEIELKAAANVSHIRDKRLGEIGCRPFFTIASPTSPVKLEACHLGHDRTAGGHLHIDLPEMPVEDKVGFIAELDRKWNTEIAPIVNTEEDVIREESYGVIGAFRYKKYGVEYRSPSNSWVNHPELYIKIWDLITATVNDYERERSNDKNKERVHP